MPSLDYSVVPVVSTMDWHVLLFSLYVACLFGILALLLLVVRKHKTSEKTINLPKTPAWRFRTQEVLSLLAWLSALAFGVITLCSHLGTIQSEDFTPNTVLFLATAFGHTTILWDMMLTLGLGQPLQHWGIGATAIMMVDSASVVLTAVQVGPKKTLLSQILPPILVTVVDGSMALFTAKALRDTEGLAAGTKPYLSTSAMLRHLHLVPLWIWPFVSTEDGHVGALACQYAQMLITIYPWRYSPANILWRWRRRSIVSKSQDDGQAESQTDGTESTRALVCYKSPDTVLMVPLPSPSQNSVPIVPSPVPALLSVATNTEQAGKSDPGGQVIV